MCPGQHGVCFSYVRWLVSLPTYSHLSLYPESSGSGVSAVGLPCAGSRVSSELGMALEVELEVRWGWEGVQRYMYGGGCSES